MLAFSVLKFDYKKVRKGQDFFQKSQGGFEKKKKILGKNSKLTYCLNSTQGLEDFSKIC